MLDTTITWGDLFKVVLFILATGVLFYLLLALANLVGILRNLNRMLDKNRSNIDHTLKKLPEITDNIAKVTDTIKKEMDSIEKVIGNVGKVSDSAKDAVEVFKKDVLLRAKSVLDVLDWIKKLFEKEDKKKEIVYKYKYRPEEETVRKGTSEQINCNDRETDKDAILTREGEKVHQGENQQGAGI